MCINITFKEFQYLFISILSANSKDFLQSVWVPRYAFAGSRVNLSCSFDLSPKGLYSLKWYHNDEEFYRYVPRDTVRPMVIKSGLKFSAHVSLLLISTNDSYINFSKKGFKFRKGRKNNSFNKRVFMKISGRDRFSNQIFIFEPILWNFNCK